MKIDPTLKKFITEGNVILFLGSGASLGAKKGCGTEMPTANELRDLLALKFLDEEWQNYPLNEVAEISISQADKVTVQNYIREVFLGFQPCEFHLKIPKFSWSGIYTTNYDLIVEDSYEQVSDKQQELIPIYRTTDRIDTLVVDKKQQLAYTKLHGCINKIDEHDLPLILTPDQYVSHKSGREALFERIVDQAISKPILFIGHSLSDPDIREVMQRISALTDSRPRCWALMYDFTEPHRSFWESKRISLIKGSFEKFINTLDSSVSEVERKFVRRDTSHPIESKFCSKDYSLTDESLRALQGPLKYISSTMPVEEYFKPELFYHGYSNGWSPIQSELDVRRRLTDEIISDVILAEESEKTNTVELFHISGSAGSGKSVLLKRIAYDAAIDYERICFFWDSSERLNANIIIELSEKINERIFLFIDKVSSHIHDLLAIISKFRKAKEPITIFVSERTNVWNTECSPLQKFLTDTFDIRRLSTREVNELIDKLSEYNCLGALADLDKKQQVEAFLNRLDRQLLVALHEATMAKSFEQIIQDEYDNIAERKAQLIYRTVCIMNQFGVPVRAGIINRIHDITFQSFKEKFFEPLENVLHIKQSINDDISYEARHPSIAEMVFTHALSTDEERLNSYLTLLQSLDIGYSADRTAFRELIKYRHLSSVFSNPEDIQKIYQQSFNVTGHDDFYYQQFAIFYMRSRKQRFNMAEKYLTLAKEYGHHNSTIDHTWAELEFIKATKSTGLERERLFNKAARLAKEASKSSSDASYGYSTLCKISIKRLEDALNTEDEELISDATDQAQVQLKIALERYPDAEILLELEARLATLLKDNERAIKALEKAFAINNTNSHLASALGNIYLAKEQISTAIEIYNKVLLANHIDKLAHSKLAHIYSTVSIAGNEEKAEYHWQRSFTDGDANVVNQVWYSRQLYINNKYEEYKSFLSKMKTLRLPPLTRHTVRGIISDGDKPAFLVGKVVKADANYILIETVGYKGVHFLHISNCPDEKWDNYSVDSEICYNLGFTVAGAAAILT